MNENGARSLQSARHFNWNVCFTGTRDIAGGGRRARNARHREATNSTETGGYFVLAMTPSVVVN